MRHAIVINGVVATVVMADANTALQNGWVPTEEAGPGWRYDGEKFIPVEEPIDGFALDARGRRNKLLQDSDVEVMADRWSCMTQERQAAWSGYRQALRDISLQPGFPRKIVWPQNPHLFQSDGEVR